jgi:hypothetical protein
VTKKKGPTPKRGWQPLTGPTPMRGQLGLDDGAILDFPSRWYENDRYVVIVREYEDCRHLVDEGIVLPEGWTWLCIVPKASGSYARPWQDFQRIKTEIVGPEREAVELYPAESRLIDTSNAWHLWCPPAGTEWPFGWFRGRLSYDYETARALGRAQRKA